MPDLQSVRLPFISRFFRRREYGVLGHDQDQDQHFSLTSPATPQAETLPTSSPHIAHARSKSVRLRSEFRLRSAGIFGRRRNAHAPQPTTVTLGQRGPAPSSPERKAAVETILSGPVPESEEERYRREALGVLRRLSASGRVPGYVY